MALHSAPWCSALALGLIWRCQVGCWGWGSCQRQKHCGNRCPIPRGEGILILNSWSVVTGPNNDQFTYISNITIGMPSQEFRFMFDTGSSAFWVSSIYCQSPSCSRQIHFNPKVSTTFHLSNQQFKFIQRSWWMEGVLGFDTIQVGVFVAVNQSFGLSQKQYNALMEHTPYDGILGLGYSNFTIRGVIAVLDNLKKLGVTCHPVFAFYFSREKEDGSAVMFGGVDHTYYKGELSWVPVSQTGFWQIAMEHISMNGTIMGCSGGCQAILDTGTSLLIGPSSLVAGIQRFINPRIIQDGQVSEILCINRFQRSTEGA